MTIECMRSPDKTLLAFLAFLFILAILMVVFPSAAMAEISFESEPVINGNITVPDETQTTLNIEKPHNSMFNSTAAIPSGTLNAKVSSTGVGVTGSNNVDPTGSSGDYNLWQVEDREFHPYKI